jgi:heterodisulfide reductase subunit A-like polyferredoxin
MLGINEATLMKKKTGDVAISFISPDLEAFQESIADEVKRLPDFRYCNGMVSEATESENGKDIQLTYQFGGTENTETFDLVVIITCPVLSEETENLAAMAGVDVTYADFLKEPGGVTVTKLDGVKLAQNL